MVCIIMKAASLCSVQLSLIVNFFEICEEVEAMKKGKVIFVVCIFLVVLPYLLIHFTNNHIAKELEKQLLRCPLPPDTEIIESTSVAGKMVGNGNGMQWFGILLVKSDMDEDQLSEWYHQKLNTDVNADIDVFMQDSPHVFEYINILFQNTSDFDRCYQIRLSGNLAVGTESSFIEELLNSDLRGH